MAKYDQVVRNASESLLEDERLRSNLTDREAKIVLEDWALEWLETRINTARSEASAKQIAKNELARVRAVVSAINALAKKPGALRLAESVGALEESLRASPAYTREEIFALLAALTSAAWKLRATK
jgi:hypothetical protein